MRLLTALRAFWKICFTTEPPADVIAEARERAIDDIRQQLLAKIKIEPTGGQYGIDEELSGSVCPRCGVFVSFKHLDYHRIAHQSELA